MMSRWQEIGIPTLSLTVLVLLCVVVSDREVDRWARRNSVTLAEGDERAIRRSIRGTRTAGVVGALLGFVVAPIALRVPIGSFAGWLVAAGVMVALLVVAELRTHRTAGRVASARLEVRDVSHYLPASIGVVARGAAIATAVLLVVAAVLPSVTGRGSHPDALELVGLIGIASLTAVVIERAQRWIVRRPQPVADEHARVLDDAMRARSVHVLAGAAVFLEAQLLAGSVWSIGYRRDWDVLGFVAAGVALAGMVYSVRVSNRRWTGRVVPTS